MDRFSSPYQNLKLKKQVLVWLIIYHKCMIEVSADEKSSLQIGCLQAQIKMKKEQRL